MDRNPQMLEDQLEPVLANRVFWVRLLATVFIAMVTASIGPADKATTTFAIILFAAAAFLLGRSIRQRARLRRRCLTTWDAAASYVVLGWGALLVA